MNRIRLAAVPTDADLVPGRIEKRDTNGSVSLRSNSRQAQPESSPVVPAPRSITDPIASSLRFDSDASAQMERLVAPEFDSSHPKKRPYRL